ncbi:hypothetical protein [Pseudomonas sp. 5P_3.1_Bac2]|uniref:hypothetical protein n=1 Tax=Pseudomonas sp. 5P_3.1_Bac2 TaxID=2971617 RepID=UPI0021C642E9|nr:hypothetical protein [Pseudomonas sp. 5P_3.1_Bac2]MCU1719246.1 hypothetical protein [Pseudomonas sp. 5P_3.1_Bac2]
MWALFLEDEQLGHLAYPIFIAHFLVFLCSGKLFQVIPSDRASYVLLNLFGTLLVAYGLSASQQQVEGYRIARRGFASMQPSQKQLSAVINSPQ